MAEATLTALMPVRAFHAPYLREAVGSMRRQTDERWRLLVIAEPGGRESVTETLLPDLEDARIDVIVNEGRALAGALNTGMRRCGSEFAAILLGDDLWAANAVAVLGDHIAASPDVDFFHSARAIIDDDGNRISSVYAPVQHVAPADFLYWSAVKHLLCWRVSKALAIGGMDESLRSVVGPDDWDFPWSMAEHGATFAPIPDCLYFWRDHRQCFRLTTHAPLSVVTRDMRRVMRKHGASKQDIRRRVRHDRASYLRSCLYRSRLDQWFRRLTRSEPRVVWRETYR
jgi:glycosyltransferase involved in cell wall biosynthesis